MGGRTHKAGHQHVYYCVHKERSWKTRGDDHPKWKRGTGCSMIRSINIAKTDQLVRNMIKDFLQQIRDRSPVLCDPVGREHHDHDDRDGFLTDGIIWMSPDLIDLLSDEEKKVVVGKMITSIKVHFCSATNKHRIDVTFSEAVAQAFVQPSEHDDNLGEGGGSMEALTGDCSKDGGSETRDSGSNFATDHAYPVTVE